MDSLHSVYILATIPERVRSWGLPKWSNPRLPLNALLCPDRSRKLLGLDKSARRYRVRCLVAFKVDLVSCVLFNSVLLNLYRDGNDSMGWHSDDEPELGQNPVIGSLSLGGTRRFMLRHRFEKGWKHQLELTSGSFLLMQGTTQHYWQHQVPKTKRPVPPPINLTFRVIC